MDERGEVLVWEDLTLEVLSVIKAQDTRPKVSSEGGAAEDLLSAGSRLAWLPATEVFHSSSNQAAGTGSHDSHPVSSIIGTANGSVLVVGNVQGITLFRTGNSGSCTESRVVEMAHPVASAQLPADCTTLYDLAVVSPADGRGTSSATHGVLIYGHLGCSDASNVIAVWSCITQVVPVNCTLVPSVYTRFPHFPINL